MKTKNFLCKINVDKNVALSFQLTLYSALIIRIQLFKYEFFLGWEYLETFKTLTK